MAYLTAEDKAFFKENGYLVVRGAVEPEGLTLRLTDSGSHLTKIEMTQNLGFVKVIVQYLSAAKMLSEVQRTATGSSPWVKSWLVRTG